MVKWVLVVKWDNGTGNRDADLSWNFLEYIEPKEEWWLCLIPKWHLMAEQLFDFRTEGKPKAKRKLVTERPQDLRRTFLMVKI